MRPFPLVRPGRLVRRHVLDLDDVRHAARRTEPHTRDLHGDGDGAGVLLQAGRDQALVVGRLGLAAQPRVMVAERPAVVGVHAVRPVAAAAVRTGDVAGGDVVVGVVPEVLVGPDESDDERHDDADAGRQETVAGPPAGDGGHEGHEREQEQAESQEAHEMNSFNQDAEGRPDVVPTNGAY